MQNVGGGRVISRLVRDALQIGKIGAVNAGAEGKAICGFRPFASRGVVVTNHVVNDLRDQEGV